MRRAAAILVCAAVLPALAQDGGGGAGPAGDPPLEHVAAQHESEGRWLEAAEAYRRAAEQIPAQRAELLFGAARSLVGFAQDLLETQRRGAPVIGAGIKAAFEDAREALARAREAGADDLDTALLLAYTLDGLGERDAQIEELRRAAERWPDRPEPARALAFALYHAERHDAAVEALAPLSAASPDDLALSLTLAAAARAAGREEVALEAARRAVTSHPGDARAWGAVWGIYAPQERWGELVEALGALAQEHPQSGHGAHYLGFALRSALRPDDALRELERAWTLLPADQAARIEAARILTERRDDPGAARLCLEVLEAEPSNPDAAAMLGYLAARRSDAGDPLGAVPLFAAVAKARPEDATAVANLALARRWAADYDGAEAAYLRAIELSPSDPQLRNDFALLLLVLDRDEEARAQLLAGHEADPRHNDCMENLGWMARDAGRGAEALEWFARAHAAAVRRADEAAAARHRRYVDALRFPLPPLR